MNDAVKLTGIYHPSSELLYEGSAMFEGSTRELIPSEQGIKYFKNSNKHMEGHFGNDWFIEYGTEYYEDENIKFIGEYNRGPRTYYGPKYFVSGKLFYKSGGLWYEGSFHFKRSPTGYPLFEKQKSFMDGIEYYTDGNIKQRFKSGIT
ncbi:hypothetical protein N4T77_15710 [Clostridium sp. CX1]|uniref:hypothetical protein n=1 Tax=Clostridium sp. CX1 TaxID=2978346 RepID=UPI0021BE1710|nr:hypothetical protein [Clostridium sp. CX1]MCT8978039.1 hypothetical protein [Clostridium sp. CX1]